MQRNTQKRENIQTTILALLLAHKGGCTLRQLDNDYLELEGERIPYKDLGYVSLLSLLHSMSKTVQLENWNGVTTVRGIASEKSKHVHKLVTGQKSQKPPMGRKLFKPSHYYPRTAPQRIHIPAEILSRIIGLIKEHPDGVSKDYIFQQVHSFIPFANISLKDIEDQLHELPHIVYQTYNKIYPVQSKDKSTDRVENGKDVSSRLITQNGKDSKLAIVTAAGEEDCDDVLSYTEEDIFEFVPSTAIPKSDQTKLTTKTQSTSSFIRESVSKCQDQITEKDSAMEIQQNNYNCNSVAETWTELNNNVKKDEQYCSQGNDAEILINERVKFRLQKLIQNHPDGIWCADLPEKYLEEYNISLSYCELGFNSVREFASQLSEIFHCVQIHDTGDFMLYDAQRELPSNKQKDKHKISNLKELHRIYEIAEEEALPGMVSLDTCKILIPDEVMTIGENVGQILVTDLLTQTVDPFVEVIVVEVFTPTFFWIQLRKMQKVFKKFMDDLHNFYVEKSEQYAIPPVVLEKGLNCACMYNGTWHRGIIKTVKPDFQVTVMFYDYGTLKTYSPDAIYYLHRIFSNLSAQAVPCGLVNVRPCKGPKWSRSATHNFAVKTSEIPLVATIASVNVEDNSMMVSLTNTLEEEDVHINDWLVEQKLAEHGKMVCTKKRNFPFHYYLECQERFNQQTSNETIKVDSHPKETAAALYKLNSDVASSNKNAPSKVSSVSSKQQSNNNSIKNDSSIEGIMCNSKTKFPQRIEALYKHLLDLKSKSLSSNSLCNKDNNNANPENAKPLDSNLQLNSPEQKSSNEEPIKSERISKNLKESREKLKCGNAEIDSSSYRRRDNEASEDILKKHANIPKQYANHFHIRDPEDELDIGHYMKSFFDTRNVNQETKDLDWSLTAENVGREKEKFVVQKNELRIPREAIFKKPNRLPLAEDCFLKAVHSSVYSALQDKNIQWSPTGNIEKDHDVSPQILRNLEKRRLSTKKDIMIAIPRDVLEILRGEPLIDNLEKGDKISSRSADNKVTNDDKVIEEESNDEESNSFNKKAINRRQALLQKLLTLRDASSNDSTLDSDDLSVSERSVSSGCNVNSNSNESKSFNETTSIESSSVSTNEIDTKCTSRSIKTSSMDAAINNLREKLRKENFSTTSENTSNESSSISWNEIDTKCLPQSSKTEPIKSMVKNLRANTGEDNFSETSKLSDSSKSLDNADERLVLEETLLSVKAKESVDTSMKEVLETKEAMETQRVSIKEPILSDLHTRDSKLAINTSHRSEKTLSMTSESSTRSRSINSLDSTEKLLLLKESLFKRNGKASADTSMQESEIKEAMETQTQSITEAISSNLRTEESLKSASDSSKDLSCTEKSLVLEESLLNEEAEKSVNISMDESLTIKGMMQVLIKEVLALKKAMRTQTQSITGAISSNNLQTQESLKSASDSSKDSSCMEKSLVLEESLLNEEAEKSVNISMDESLMIKGAMQVLMKEVLTLKKAMQTQTQSITGAISSNNLQIQESLKSASDSSKDSSCIEKSLMLEKSLLNEDVGKSVNISKEEPLIIKEEMQTQSLTIKEPISSNLHTQELFKSMINNSDACKKTFSVTSETSTRSRSIRSVDSTKESMLQEESLLNVDATESTNTSMEESLLINETTETQMMSIKEPIPSNLHIEKSFKSVIDNLNACEAETSIMSETSTSDSSKDLSCTEKSLLLEESVLSDEDSKESGQSLIEEDSKEPGLSLIEGDSKESEQSLIEEEEKSVIKETQIVPINEERSIDVINGASNIPVFNDLDVESDDEEWDAQVSYADLCDLLRGSCPFNNSIQDRFERDGCNSRLEIKEVDDDDSIEENTCLETYKNADGEIYEVMYSDRDCLNEEKGEEATDKCEELEIQIKFESVIDSENNIEPRIEYTPNPKNIVEYKIQGKAKSLVKMLNKAKLLQRDRLKADVKEDVQSG